MSDPLRKRGSALEELFFEHVDNQLLDNLRAEISKKEAAVSLAQITGIDNADVINSMIDQGVTTESMTGMSLIPLVAVAWADGVIQPNERAAIMRAAHENGVVEAPAAIALLEVWLEKQPNDSLLDAWKNYILELKNILDPTSFSQMRLAVLSRAESVAKSAGGFLGMASVSESETKVLDRLDRILN